MTTNRGALADHEIETSEPHKNAIGSSFKSEQT